MPLARPVAGWPHHVQGPDNRREGYWAAGGKVARPGSPEMAISGDRASFGWDTSYLPTLHPYWTKSQAIQKQGVR